MFVLKLTKKALLILATFLGQKNKAAPSFQGALSILRLMASSP